MTRPLHNIADEIMRDWSKVSFAAVPYLRAMCYLDKVTDSYGEDTGRTIVLYFLQNASTWRGDTAKRVKAELNGMLK